MASSKAGVSHGRVLVECEHSLKQYLNLEKVVPAMVEKKIFPKKFGKALVKKNDKGTFIDCLKNLTLDQFGEFLTVVWAIEEEKAAKERPLMKLLSTSLKNMKLEPDSSAETVISNFIQAADRPPTSTQQSSMCVGYLTSMDGSLVESTKVQIPSPAAVSILKPNDVNVLLCATKTEDVNTQPTTACGSNSDEAVTAVAVKKLPFPKGFMKGSRIRSFTGEGGMLYSPEHGVTVIIPEASVPSSVEKFFLGVYVYLNGPFSLPQDAQPCSPVVWFYLHPKFTFENDVTVKMPHCAIPTAHVLVDDSSTPAADEEFLSVLTVEEGQDETASCFALTRHLDADFSDGYHAVFSVKHFSPHRVVKCPRKNTSPSRNRLGSNESSGVRKRTRDNQNSTANRLPGKSQTTTTKELKKSGSLQDDDIEEDKLYQVTPGEPKKEKSRTKQIDLKFCIARCMPMDRSSNFWMVDFLISHFHSTGIFAIEQLGKQLHGKTVDMVKRKFYFTAEDLEFVPATWTNAIGSWNVGTTAANVLSMDEVLMQLPPLPAQRCDQMESESSCQPPRVTYSIEAVTFPPKEHLDCTVQVRGAVAAGGKVPYFRLLSKTTAAYPRKSTTRRRLYTVPYLYLTTSDIPSAVAHCNRSLRLNLQDPEHIKFLIDISLQLTNEDHPILLASALHLKPQQLEEIQQNTPNDSTWQVYCVLRMWLANSSSSSETTLGTLFDALSKIEVEGVKLFEDDPCGPENNISLVPSKLDNEPIPNAHRSEEGEYKYRFLLNLGVMLQCCWRKVCSLMGVPKSAIDVKALEYPQQLSEQSYQMLLSWQKERGREATFDVVFRATQRMREHNPDIVNDAWCYCVHVHQLEQNSNYSRPRELPIIVL